MTRAENRRTTCFDPNSLLTSCASSTTCRAAPIPRVSDTVSESVCRVPNETSFSTRARSRPGETAQQRVDRVVDLLAASFTGRLLPEYGPQGLAVHHLVRAGPGNDRVDEALEVSEKALELQIQVTGGRHPYAGIVGIQTGKLAWLGGVLLVIVAGGATLKGHWNRGTDKDTARGKITAEKWDYVILQDYSSVTSREEFANGQSISCRARPFLWKTSRVMLKMLRSLSRTPSSTNTTVLDHLRLYARFLQTWEP